MLRRSVRSVSLTYVKPLGPSLLRGLHHAAPLEQDPDHSSPRPPDTPSHVQEPLGLRSNPRTSGGPVEAAIQKTASHRRRHRRRRRDRSPQPVPLAPQNRVREAGDLPARPAAPGAPEGGGPPR